MRSLVHRGESNSFRFGFGLTGTLFAFHDVLGLTVFFLSITMTVGVLLVHGRVADRFGFALAVTAALLALLDVLDLTVFFGGVSMAFRA